LAVKQAESEMGGTRERRILVLANKAVGIAPGQRYRFEQWAPYLERQHGIVLDLLPFESPGLTEILYEPGHITAKAARTAYDFFRRSEVLDKASGYDGIVVFREAALLGPAIYERLLAWTGKPIVYDFDDAIWSPGQIWQNGIFSRLRFPGKTSAICKLASAITVGNDYLAAYARQRNANTFVVPSTIDLSEYPFIPEPREHGKFIVCWTGSISTLAHFERGRPALERLATKVPLLVKVICSAPSERPIAGAEMRFIPWTAEREAQDVGSCHVGIMPLPDDEFSRGKCAMKALQYMATGRPVVISPVGVNVDVVEHGCNGFLAGTNEEWVEALLQLARSPELRKQMGLAARETVVERYSAEVGSRKFADAVWAALD
jgi:glycosyltransferase involved in cell wall biosynthesis